MSEPPDLSARVEALAGEVATLTAHIAYLRRLLADQITADHQHRANRRGVDAKFYATTPPDLGDPIFMEGE